MAENANKSGVPGERSTSEPPERTSPGTTERTQGHERPMDDPGRGHGDKLEDEIPHGGKQNAQQR